MQHLRKSLVALACAAAATGGTAAVFATPLSAADFVTACTAGGTVNVAPATTGYTWTIQGAGSCIDVSVPLSDTQTVQFSGTGTSASLGLCAGVVVTNLSIPVTVVFTDVVTGTTRTLNEIWSLPITTYPIATPFLISGDASGAGTMVSHILAQCPPNGTPSAEFAWAQTK